MKHCAKKLLGLAFALALCLAVGGTALADGPEAADAWMLADEPNVTTAPDTTTVGDLANDGYTVTIPTTVEVNSGENKDKLKVKAQLKQWRTLNIGITSQNSWQLKYQDAAAGADTPKVDYTLKNEAGGGYTTQNMVWYYNESTHEINYVVTGVTSVDTAEIPLSVNVTDPSQATMSGTYSDTLTFTFNLTKQSVTYTINVYHQEMALTNNSFNRADNAPKYQALKMVDKVGTNGAPIGDAQPDEVYTYEYGFANDKPVGSPPGTWTRPRTGHSVSEDEDTRCWEDLTYDLNLQQNYNEDKKDIVVNLNLVRKWCWLDVNGITNKDENGVPADGNQGGKIASFVNIKVSDGKSWSVWYWYTTGDDYWGTFPYGTEFQLGLHRVKDGYAYDTDDAGNVAIYANDKLEYKTNPPISENGTTYRVYQGKLEGKPVDETLHPTSGGGNVHDGAGGKALPRYCYNVCFVDGITYYANGGTGGREDTNIHHGPHTTFQYTTAGMTLADPLSDELTGCKFTAPAGKEFAGWSTTKDYIAGQTKLYAPGTPESKVEWPTPKPSTSHNDTLPNKDGQTVCRTLYAQWGYNITVQFEDEKGYSTNDGSGPVATRGGTMDDKYSFTLEKQVVADGADWTLDLTNSVVQEKITAATNAAKAAAGDTRTEVDNNFVWKIGNGFENKISAADLKKGKRTLTIQRRRYLLSVISADTDTDHVNAISTKANENKFGTFDVTIDGISGLGVTGKSHCQVGLNYGAKYTVSNMKGISPYIAMEVVLLKSLTPGDSFQGWLSDATIMKFNADPYTSYMTGKQTDIHYYTSEGVLAGDGYIGDPVRVAFNNNSNSTSKPGPNRAPARKALTLRYHANFDPNEELALDLDPDPLLDDMDDTFGFDPDPLLEDVDDALEGAVKTVSYQPGEDVVLRNCMFKRSGYVFVGWNTEPDGTGRLYRVNGVPITDWAAGDTVDLYAQWKKPDHLKPVVDNEPFVPTDPDTPPEELDPGFGIDPDADPADEEGPADDADAVDDAPAVADEEAAAAPPEELDFGFGIDPDAAVGGPAPFVRW